MKSNSFPSNRHTFNLNNFLPKHAIEYLCEGCERFRVYDPASTLYCFLFQVLDGCSAKSALVFFSLQRKRLKLKKISLNTSAFTKAKKRLCESRLKYLVNLTGTLVDDQAKSWRFKNRDIYLGDGTIINLEDTKQIKKEYPLTYANARAQGQPKMRLFGVFSASSGSFLDGELGSYSGKGQGETTLFRKMVARLKKGSILVLDRFFTSYQLQALMRDQSIDYVIRARDKSTKKILGRSKDKVMKIKNEKRGSANYFLYEQAPDYLKIRYLKSSIKRPGFRTAHIYILTNLFIEDGFSKQDIEKIYLKRWAVEVDIRHLKITLEGSILRSKTPSQSRKELWVHLLAYNLIRAINNINANKYNKEEPCKQSFKTAVKAYLYRMINGSIDDSLFEDLENEILKSKYRREPRAIKKRLQRYPLLTTDRKSAKNEKWGYSRRRVQKGLKS